MMEPLFTDLYLETIPQVCICKDLEGRIYQCTNYFAKLVGFKHWHDSIGVSAQHFPHPGIASQAATITAQEQSVINSGKSIKLLDLHTYHENQRKAFLSTITALHDQQGNICGTYTNSIELNSRGFAALYKALQQNDGKFDINETEVSLTILNDFDAIGLSKREAECLYYLLRGQSSSAIGKRLGIAGGTVEVYVANIKSKLRCKKKSDLIEHCVEHGYTYFIPSTLLPTDITEVIAA